MRDMTGSWLSGPGAALPGPDDPQAHPGEAMGLPGSGVGSLAGTGRRLGALTLDWLMALGVAGAVLGDGLGGRSTSTLLVWALVGVVSVGLFAFTPGQFVLGLRVVPVPTPAQAGAGAVVRLDAAVGLLRALVRQLLLALVIPGVAMDRDGRGLQDRLTSTAVLRVR